MTSSILRSTESPGTAAAFDPLARFYVARDAAPVGVGAVDMTALSAYQRALLAIDGTVTQFIEAWALEPVDVIRLDQCERPLDQADPWLDLGCGEHVIRRRVLLRGRASGRFYAWADSTIAVARLAGSMRTALEAEGGGIGRVLMAAGTESRREALWYGIERPTDIPPGVIEHVANGMLVRAYRVLVGSRPLMIIVERFPL